MEGVQRSINRGRPVVKSAASTRAPVMHSASASASIKVLRVWGRVSWRDCRALIGRSRQLLDACISCLQPQQPAPALALHQDTEGFKQGLVQGTGHTDRPKDSAGPTSSGQMPASVRAAEMPRASISTEEPMTGSTCACASAHQSGWGNSKLMMIVSQGCDMPPSNADSAQNAPHPWNLSAWRSFNNV